MLLGHYDRSVDRFSPSLTLRTLVRAVLPLFVIAVLLPAAASAQAPGTGGYAGTAPTSVEGTTPPPPPPPASGTQAAETSGSSQPAPAQTVTTPSTATLPFTGLQIAFMLAAGLGLLGLGLALRRVSSPALPGS